ncbi:glycosyltransferase family 2 protein [Quadrisphaera sp. DSM 44207]|uniref:glycosyltransferase family 2 protein n=1 Tax=Quadrisphaera sp. DSM 44207 TaxID=1881057 RepID=UPI00088AB21C|nr:glycosyltransferase family 2 protein [Quadrisphaera sp. DSM 44207]SDQ63709.1 Glycosyl transferase family 2 [Quadrisphaera sp. DSM 44207]
MAQPLVSVLVPVHQQAAFLPRALASLLAQDEQRWEALVLDDGSTDDVAAALEPFARDPRVRTAGWARNRGLGATLNAGLDVARAPVLAHLPADDVWYRDHLSSLLAVLADPAVVLAHTGVRSAGDRVGLGAPGTPYLQLVQVAHRAGAHRWTEREELESDDLDLLMWRRVAADGATGSTGRVTCEWTDHPAQRHKAIRELFDGGLNVFRRRYDVRHPLRFRSTDSGTVDEVTRYARFREPEREPEHGHGPERAPSAGGLDVLLVGELAFNPERVLALSERGHRLRGLWTDEGLGDSTVGPLPFGRVRDLPRTGWQDVLRADPPDVLYALLNWRAVRFVHAVRRAAPHLPFVWHFKEAPQASLRRGDWPLLADLVTGADACLVATEEERAWFLQALPGRLDPQRITVMDGDLPKRDWLDAPASPKLSDADGQVHTVVAGRPNGLDAAWVVGLARLGVHTHLYGQVASPGPGGAWRRWWDDARRAAPGHLHLHPAVGPQDWVRELSRFDAAWLHRFTSANGGDVRAATWDDLNSPARLPVHAAAGLPSLQQANPGHLVAVERVLRESGTGLLYRDLEHAVELLHAERASRTAGRATWAGREALTFDAHADRLVEVLRGAVARRG